jgi:hypothetical protein
MGPAVALTIEIEGTTLVGELVECLAAAGCLVVALDDRRCRIVHPDAVDAVEEWNEVRFFARAWQAGRDVRLTIHPERVPAARAQAG